MHIGPGLWKHCFGTVWTVGRWLRSEAFYQANEAPDREDYPNLLTTAKYGLDVLIFDHRTPQSVLQFLCLCYVFRSDPNLIYRSILILPGSWRVEEYIQCIHNNCTTKQYTKTSSQSKTTVNVTTNKTPRHCHTRQC